MYALNILLSLQNETSCEQLDGDLKRVTFATTPIMSSYLLAFVVGEFDYVEERDSNGVLVRVYTPVGKSNLGQFALDVSSLSLSLSLIVYISKLCSSSPFSPPIACCQDAALLHRLLWCGLPSSKDGSHSYP